MRDNEEQTIHNGGRWAFLLVVLATFLPVFGRNDFEPLAVTSLAL